MLSRYTARLRRARSLTMPRSRQLLLHLAVVPDPRSEPGRQDQPIGVRTLLLHPLRSQTLRLLEKRCQWPNLTRALNFQGGRLEELIDPTRNASITESARVCSGVSRLSGPVPPRLEDWPATLTLSVECEEQGREVTWTFRFLDEGRASSA